MENLMFSVSSIDKYPGTCVLETIVQVDYNHKIIYFLSDPALVETRGIEINKKNRCIESWTFLFTYSVKFCTFRKCHVLSAAVFCFHCILY